MSYIALTFILILSGPVGFWTDSLDRSISCKVFGYRVDSDLVVFDCRGLKFCILTRGMDTDRSRKLVATDADADADGVGDELEWQQVRRNKRIRNSTGGTFSTQVTYETTYKVSKEDFKKLSTDDKLISLYDMMLSLGSVNARVQDLEHDVQALTARNLDYDTRIKYLEYKNIDLEARSRRNNLIFRGLNELVGETDCEPIIYKFLAEHLLLDIDNICIQRAHRLGNPNPPQRRWAAALVKRRGPRPIIVCFRDYKVIELIMSKAKMLKGKEYGINRDYPNEIISARSKLWADYKSAKDLYKGSGNKVSIGFPAKLIINGKVTRDEFPDWRQVLSSKGKNPASFVTDTSKMTRDSVPIMHAPVQPPVREPILVSTSSADHSVFGATDDRNVHDLSMETEKSEHSDDDGADDKVLNPAGVCLPAEPASPSDQYSQAMKHLESFQERGNNLPPPIPSSSALDQSSGSTV